MSRKLNKAQKQLLNRYDTCRHESELPNDVLNKLIQLNNYDEVYMDVNRYLFDTYVQLRGTPFKKENS